MPSNCDTQLNISDCGLTRDEPEGNLRFFVFMRGIDTDELNEDQRG